MAERGSFGLMAGERSPAAATLRGMPDTPLALDAPTTAANLALCLSRCIGQFSYFELPNDPRVSFDRGFIPMSGSKVYGLPDAQQALIHPPPTGGTTLGWTAVYRGTPMALYAPCDPAYEAMGKAFVIWEALRQFNSLDIRTPLTEQSLMPPPVPNPPTFFP